MRKMTIFILALAMLLPSPVLAALDVGEKAPDFKGNSTQGEIKRSHYLGKKHVVLALFFAAFTPV